MAGESQEPEQAPEAAEQAPEVVVRDLIRKAVGSLAPRSQPVEVRESHLLSDELGYDSVRLVELTFLLEELFGFESSVVEDSPTMESVGDLETYALDMVAQGRARVPSESEIAGAWALVSTTARPS